MPTDEITNYSKREIDLITAPITIHLEKQDEILSRIEAQTLKTNGRVSKLEWWKSIIIWTFGTIFALAYPIIMFIQHEINLEINSSITSVLSQYNIVVH